MTNKELVERYPFLRVNPEYNYPESPEELYSEKGLYLPEGWYELFLKCCEELREALIKINKLDEFRIDQLKEKYGLMRIYANISDPVVDKIINRYEIISQFTCCVCGKIATVETTGWVCPYCDDCIQNVNTKFRELSEYICMTKFDGDKTHKHFYCVDNLPYDENDKNEYHIIAKDGTIIIPFTWTKKFFVKEYLDSVNIKEKTVCDVSDEIEELLGK